MRILHYAFSNVRYYRKRFFLLSLLFLLLYGSLFFLFALELTQKALFLYLEQMMDTLKNWVPSIYALFKKELALQSLEVNGRFVFYFLLAFGGIFLILTVTFLIYLRKRRQDFETFLRYRIHPFRIITQFLCEIWLAFFVAFSCVFACSLLFQHSLFTKTQKMAVVNVTQQDTKKIEASILTASQANKSAEQAIVIPYELFNQRLPYLNDQKVNHLFFVALFKSFAYFAALVASLSALCTASYLSYLKFYPLKE